MLTPYLTGMLDTDHVHISMDNDIAIGRHWHHPQSIPLQFLGSIILLIRIVGEIVDIIGNSGPAFREMLCNGCWGPLRGYFWYECARGCVLR
jgi:hypothetical protein